jgi:hypothetical protein
MKYKIIVKEQAKSEIEEIAHSYNIKQNGLGYEFWDAVEIALQDIVSNPLGYQIKYDVYRTKLIKPFPYLLIFELIGKEVIVYQCFGGKENPMKKYRSK